MCEDCARLHEQLQQQSEDMYKLRRRIKSLYGELNYERKSKEALLKEKRKNIKPKFRKGQKRGSRGMNG